MELWEFNSCVKAYNKKQEAKSKNDLITSWQIANFCGAAFQGKLKKLDNYLKQIERRTAPTVSKDEFEEKLRLAEQTSK